VHTPANRLLSHPAARIFALIATLAIVLLAGAIASATTGSSTPPWGSRCAVELRAYEDGSASLYCQGSPRRFGTIDAESGRTRVRWPFRRMP
jgi:hypothetical protein